MLFQFTTSGQLPREEACETVSGDYTQADYDADLAAADATMKADIEAARQVYVAAWVSAVTSYLLDIATNNETHQTTINQAEKDATDAIEDAKKLRDDAVALENQNLIDAKSTNRETANVDEANQIKQQFVDAVTLLGAAATSGQVYEKDKTVAHANRVTGSEGKLKALVGSLNDAIKTYANATSLAFQSYYKTMATHDQTVKQTINEAHRVAVNSSGNGLQDLANTGFYKTDMPGTPKPGSVTMPSLLEETIEDFFDAFDKPNYQTEMYAVTGQEALTGEYHWNPDGQNINGRHTRSGPGDLTTQTVRKDPTVGGTDPYVSESVYSQPQTTGDSLANSGNQIGGSGAMLTGGSNDNVKAKLSNGKSGLGDGETVGKLLGQQLEKDVTAGRGIGAAVGALAANRLIDNDQQEDITEENLPNISSHKNPDYEYLLQEYFMENPFQTAMDQKLFQIHSAGLTEAERRAIAKKYYTAIQKSINTIEQSREVIVSGAHKNLIDMIVEEKELDSLERTERRHRIKRYILSRLIKGESVSEDLMNSAKHLNLMNFEHLHATGAVGCDLADAPLIIEAN